MRKINPITPSTIVSQRFIIPLYQRLFEWEDEQLSVLLNDLKERFFITRRSINERYLQPIITQYFIDNKSEIWLLFLIAHSKR